MNGARLELELEDLRALVDAGGAGAEDLAQMDLLEGLRDGWRSLAEERWALELELERLEQRRRDLLARRALLARLAGGRQ